MSEGLRLGCTALHSKATGLSIVNSSPCSYCGVFEPKLYWDRCVSCRFALHPLLMSNLQIKWQCQQRDCCSLISFNCVADWSLTPYNDRLITPSAEALQCLLREERIIIVWAFFFWTGKLRFLLVSEAGDITVKLFVTSSLMLLFLDSEEFVTHLLEIRGVFWACICNERKAVTKHNYYIDRKFSVTCHRAAAAPAVFFSGACQWGVINVPGGKNLSVWGFSSFGLEICVERNASAVLQRKGATVRQKSLWLPIAAHTSRNVCEVSMCIALAALWFIAKEKYLHF